MLTRDVLQVVAEPGGDFFDESFGLHIALGGQGLGSLFDNRSDLGRQGEFLEPDNLVFQFPA